MGVGLGLGVEEGEGEGEGRAGGGGGGEEPGEGHTIPSAHSAETIIVLSPGAPAGAAPPPAPGELAPTADAPLWRRDGDGSAAAAPGSRPGRGLGPWLAQ